MDRVLKFNLCYLLNFHSPVIHYTISQEHFVEGILLNFAVFMDGKQICLLEIRMTTFG